MISALAKPSLPNCAAQRLGLGVLERRSSITTMPPSLALAESAWRNASARTFFGRSSRGCARPDRRHGRRRGTAARAPSRDGRRRCPSGVHLLGGAVDLGADLGLVRAGAGAWRAATHAALDEIDARLEPENLVCRVGGAGLLAFERGDLEFHIRRPLRLRPAAVSAGCRRCRGRACVAELARLRRVLRQRLLDGVAHHHPAAFRRRAPRPRSG